MGRRGDPGVQEGRRGHCPVSEWDGRDRGVEGEGGKGMQEEEGDRRQRSVVKDGSKL